MTTEQDKANKDLMQYGQSFMLGGKHIPIDEVLIEPKMTTNNEAFKAYLNKFKHVTGGLRVYSELNEHEKSIAKDAWQAATTEANKRMVELEGEVAELKESNSLLVSMNISLAKENSELQVQLQNWKDFSKKIQKIDFNDYLKLQASNNHLREAIIKIEFEYDYTLDSDMTNAVTEGVKLARATPAESLQAFENEVIEKCAKVCESINKYTQFQTVEDYKLVNEAARNIRALKEVK